MCFFRFFVKIVLDWCPWPCCRVSSALGSHLSTVSLSFSFFLHDVPASIDGTGGLSCKLKRRYFVVHDTNSPKRGSMELALCQYSKREAVKVRWDLVGACFVCLHVRGHAK